MVEFTMKDDMEALEEQRAEAAREAEALNAKRKQLIDGLDEAQKALRYAEEAAAYLMASDLARRLMQHRIEIGAYRGALTIGEKGSA